MCLQPGGYSITSFRNCTTKYAHGVLQTPEIWLLVLTQTDLLAQGAQTGREMHWLVLLPPIPVSRRRCHPDAITLPCTNTAPDHIPCPGGDEWSSQRLACRSCSRDPLSSCLPWSHAPQRPHIFTPLFSSQQLSRQFLSHCPTLPLPVFLPFSHLFLGADLGSQGFALHRHGFGGVGCLLMSMRNRSKIYDAKCQE